MSTEKGQRVIETAVIRCDHGRDSWGVKPCREKISGDTLDEAAQYAADEGWDCGNGGKYNDERPESWDLCPAHKDTRPAASDEGEE